LHAACYYGRVDLVKALASDCDEADLMAPNVNGWHSIIFTVMGSSGRSEDDIPKYTAIVKYLVQEKHANILIRDCSGKDALYYA
jgi:hypothetical protein